MDKEEQSKPAMSVSVDGSVIIGAEMDAENGDWIRAARKKRIENFRNTLNKIIIEQVDKVKWKSTKIGLNSLMEVLNNDENSKGDYPTTPGKPNLHKIKSTGETAYQRAIFNSKHTLLNSSESIVQWLDLELPVTLNKNPRRPCVDLIGRMNNQIVLCELKFCRNCKNYASNHPIYGVIELLVYYYFIQRNHSKLDDYEVFHSCNGRESFKWREFLDGPSTLCIVAANIDYWESWFNKIDKSDFIQDVSNLADRLNIKVSLFKAPNEDFSRQFDEKGYSPTLTFHQAWSIIM